MERTEILRTIFLTGGYKNIEFRLKDRMDESYKDKARAENSIVQYFGDLDADPGDALADELEELQTRAGRSGSAWNTGEMLSLIGKLLEADAERLGKKEAELQSSTEKLDKVKADLATAQTNNGILEKVNVLRAEKSGLEAQRQEIEESALRLNRQKDARRNVYPLYLNWSGKAGERSSTEQKIEGSTQLLNKAAESAGRAETALKAAQDRKDTADALQKKADKITEQEPLYQRRESLAGFLDGLKTFIIGLGFKVIIANQLGSIWTAADTIGYSSISVGMAWLSMIGYSFQLFFDFCGYSYMAIGLGRMMGFEFPQNFNSPYVSVSMTEFWRRWHMTLGAWFREYVYIPLGGNRKGPARTTLNLFVVWMLTGIWHGADWNFVIWGLVLFLIISAEKQGVQGFMESHRAVGHVYMILLIPLQWMVFAISDLGQLGTFYGRLIGIGGENVSSGDWLLQLKDFWWLLIIAAVLSTELPGKLYRKFKDKWFIWIPLAGILGVAVYCLIMGMNDPFMYFRF